MHKMAAYQQHKYTHGFSLVELAIVLVIIGLITGGILTGQDLIKASEVNSIYADVNKYKTAYNTFRIKYSAFPGDMLNATSYWTAETCPGSVGGNATGTCNGDNDGTIDYADFITPGSTNEHYRAWEHLGLAGLVPGSYAGLPATATAATAMVAGTNVPAHRVGGGYFMWRTITASTTWYSLSGTALIAYGPSNGSSLSTQELASLDSKYDDGLPAFGSITSPSLTGWSACVSSDTATSATYVVASTGTLCLPVFWIK